MRIVAYVVFAVSAWLTNGANSLHYKDPAHYGMGLVWVLFTIATVSGVFAVLATGKDKATTR
ncbi:hypothetical protein AB0L41_42795 [Amycolatopsis mediterranei]|uniref:hypothetical protein n=1 Tax=Amycolatopsis mediterranei TaxID=33910 RepID=UPI003436F638